MNVVLGIDTSSTDLSVGLYLDKKPLASFCRFTGNSHAEHIASAIRNLLDSADISVSTLKWIAIAIGPGSFTGLRIGVAFLKGFCIGKDVRVLPISSLFILSHAAVSHEGRIVAAIDARNNEVYWACFKASGGRIERLSDDTVVSLEHFSHSLDKDDIIVIDTVGYEKSTVFPSLEGRYRLLNIEKHQLHRGLLCAAHGARVPDDSDMWIDARDVRPNYLRSWTPKVPSPKRCGL